MIARTQGLVCHYSAVGSQKTAQILSKCGFLRASAYLTEIVNEEALRSKSPRSVLLLGAEAHAASIGPLGKKPPLDRY